MTSSENHRKDLINRVFGHEPLLERIMDYVIHDGHKVYVRDVRACRLVQKDWLQSVSNCLRNSRKPLFHFVVRSHSECAMKRTVDAITNSFRLKEQIPPIKIQLDQTIYQLVNFRRLAKHLSHISNSIVSLSVEIPIKNTYGCDWSEKLSGLSLPHLQDLKIQTVLLDPAQTSMFKEFKKFANNFIQSIMSGYHQELQSSSAVPYSHCPHSLLLEVLPSLLRPTLTTLDLRHVKIAKLMNPPLPKLTTLSMTLPQCPFEDKQDLRILYNYSSTLKSLTLWTPDRRMSDQNVDATPIDLPLMENLEMLTVNSWNYKWSKDFKTVGLEQLLPKLKKVKLLSTPSVAVFRQWTQESQFHSVKDVAVSFQFNINNIRQHIYSMDVSRLICHAFPNVLNLDISLIVTEVEGLQYIFRNMIQLTELRMTVQITHNIYTTDTWDSLLLGISVDQVRTLCGTQEFGESEIEHPSINPRSSILNLTNLRKLHLHSTADTGPIISDVIFTFGFLKMTNLKQLKLTGRFMASNTMAEKWKDENRLLE